MGPKAKSSMPVLKVYYGQLTTDRRLREEGSVLDAMAHINPDDKEVIDTVLSLVSLPAQPRLGVVPDRRLGITLLPIVKADPKSKVKALIAALADAAYRPQVVAELGKLGADAREALPLLKKLKLDPNQAVRDAVGPAIENIDQ
jgi:hypothetical protein